MVNPSSGKGVSQPSPSRRTRRKTACQRCRLRKQKCDGQEPMCKNCAASGSKCLPATIDAVELYEISYVQSLERRVAELESSAHVPSSGVPPDLQMVTEPQPAGANWLLDTPMPTDPMHWQYSFYSPILNVHGVEALADIGMPHPNTDLPFQIHTQAIPTEVQESNALDHEFFGLDSARQPASSDIQPSRRIPIPQPDAAKFLQLYFDKIHQRYPFLDVEECSDAYLYWKGLHQAAERLQADWYSFLLTLIFAIGSTLEQQGGNPDKERQHEMLLTRVQAERGVISSQDASPLTRLKAMLLHVILALHEENTSRLVHLSGVMVRFATLHGFHRLAVSEDDRDIDGKIKAWSCIYALDRMISGTLRIPICVAEAFITTPLYRSKTPYLCSMPWILDSAGNGEAAQILEMSTFTHMLRIRYIQSRIMCTMPTLRGDEVDAFIKTMEAEVAEWSTATQLSEHSKSEDAGYLSSLWLQYMACVARVVLYSSCGTQDYELPRAELLLKACCDTCDAFRAVQKRRQLVRSWIDMVFDFQAGITVLYLTWRGQVNPGHKHAERSVRNCTSSLAILAEGAPNVEVFRDCLDALATYVAASKDVHDAQEDRELRELKAYSRKVIDLGVSPDVAGMLLEMSDARA